MVRSRAIDLLRTRREATVLGMLIVVFVVLSFASPFFLTPRNLSNVAQQISVVGIVALGQALVIIAGGIDLSVGSIIGLAAVSGAMLSASTGSPLIGLVGSIALGAFVGLLNGTLVTFGRINPFITTLGTLSVARGAALLITNGNPQRFDNWAAWLGHGRIGLVPVQFLILVVLTVLVWIFATQTRWGRNVYAVGDSARAAKLAGIDVTATRILVFTLSGSLAGLGGLLLGGLLTNANPNLGLGYELDVIAAVILGGVALTGGRGAIGGVVIGATLIGLLRNAFVLLNVSGYWQTIAIGLVVILAVGADSLNRAAATPYLKDLNTTVDYIQLGTGLTAEVVIAGSWRSPGIASQAHRRCMTGKVGVVGYDDLPEKQQYKDGGEIFALIDQAPARQSFDSLVMLHNIVGFGATYPSDVAVAAPIAYGKLAKT